MFSLKRLIGASAHSTVIALTSGTYLDTTTSPPSIFTYRGYSDTLNGGFGSVSPTSLNGASLKDIYIYEQTLISPDSLYVRVNGTVSQNFFTRVYTSGTGWLNAADADTFTQSGGTTSWYWQAVADQSTLTSQNVIFE